MEEAICEGVKVELVLALAASGLLCCLKNSTLVE